jgi:putative aldouronate transport system substrate-binding protein
VTDNSTAAVGVPISRRGFLRGSAGSALLAIAALPLLEACAPAAPRTAGGAAAGAPAANGAGQSNRSANGPLPAFIPFAQPGLKPDFHVDDPRYDDGYDNYPQQRFKAVAEKPGAGGTISALITNYIQPPTPYEQNTTWQYINTQLNATVRMNIVASPDYRAKFATVMAGDDLPDIMHIYYGYSLAPNLPAFLKAKCADLTPYLAGDAIKEYPYLAALPTYAWKNSTAAIDGQLFLVPIQRHLPTFPGNGGYFQVQTEAWNKEIGAGYVPSDGADFKRVLRTLTHPQQGVWGFGYSPGGGAANTIGPFGVAVFAAQLFGGPNLWQLEPGGKLLRDWETEAYKAATSYLRDLMASGVVPPDVSTIAQSRPQHAAGRYVVALDGYGNSMADLWRRGQPERHFHLLPFFSAEAGIRPNALLSKGYISLNALKKAPPERIKELLRVLNFLAAPFGSEEDLLLSYGIKDQDYTLDERGNPVPTPDGLARSAFVPWQYLARRPHVNYQADLPGFARASYDAQQMIMPSSVEDPTNGYYAPTAFSKGVTADVAMNDGLLDIILGRRPFSDYDTLLSDWRSAAGDQVRKEYLQAMSA